MENLKQYSYLFNITEKELNSVIYDLGTDYDRIHISGECCLVSERYPLEDKPLSNEIFFFLEDINYIDEYNHWLTEEGKNYFKIAFILCDIEKGKALIKNKLLNNPIVNLIGQVFFGRGNITKEQLLNLLKHHNIADYVVQEKELGRLLIFLNKYSIITYSTKNNIFYVPEPLKVEEAIEQYFVEPSTPYSNIYNLRKVFRNLNGDLFWLDKHFRKEAFEIIVDSISSENIKSLTIISSSENVTESAKKEFAQLKTELASRRIDLNWSLIEDKEFKSKWHDRWLLGDNLCYNIPPVLAIIRGQLSEMIQTPTRPDIDKFLPYCQDILL